MAEQGTGTDDDVAAERHRVTVLRRYDVLDLEPDRSHADLVRLAAAVGDAGVAVVSLVDEDRVWHLAAVGATPPQLPRQGTLADAVVRADAPVAVHEGGPGSAFLADPLVGGLGATSAYAVPLRGQDVVLGCVVVADDRPGHRLSNAQRDSLAVVADRVAAELELRRVRVELALELGARELQRREDELTGLPLRRPVYERAAIEFARYRRHLAPLSVAIVDLDDFAGFRHRHGGSAADLLLQRVAAAMAAGGRIGDLVGRWDDHRFALLLCDTATDGATAVLERVRGAVADAHVDGLGVTCSVGFVEAGPDVLTFADAVRRSTSAAVAAAEAGGDRVEHAAVG